MTKSAASRDAEVQRYLDTGDHDSAFAGWPGDNFIDSARKGSATLREALNAQVRSRTASRKLSPAAASRPVNGLTLTKVSPMVAGLFPQAEAPAVLGMLERSVVFLTPANIEEVLRTTRWLRTAWSLANLYLVSVGAERLSDEAPEIVGLSQETTCYVSPSYFDEQDPFADFVVHETAHIFHNCNRGTIGLPQTRRREWLLDVDFGRRETFAYACEAYSRIAALATTAKGRREALARHADGPLPGDPSVDADEYLDILHEAAQARNGWKRILQRCAPPKSSNAAMNRARLPPAAGL